MVSGSCGMTQAPFILGLPSPPSSGIPPIQLLIGDKQWRITPRQRAKPTITYHLPTFHWSELRQAAPPNRKKVGM